MSLTAGTLHVLLGVVYAQYGTMTLIEMRRQRTVMGFSHFGAAWVAMAFTCGPHHFFHGVHLLFEGREATALDLVTVAVSLPAGLVWFALRVEAFLGGQGDRHIPGSPRWVLLLPTLLAMYVAVAATTAFYGPAPRLENLPGVSANLLLVILYAVIAVFVSKTQLANRGPLGGWSASGLSLAVIFASCSVMHGIGALHTLTGQYDWDVHMGVTDIVGVPAAVYFLVVVRALQRGTFRDWNSVSKRLGAAGAPAGEPREAAASASA